MDQKDVSGDIRKQETRANSAVQGGGSLSKPQSMAKRSYVHQLDHHERIVVQV